MKKCASWARALCAVCAAGTLRADNIMGAAEVLREVAGRIANANPGDGTKSSAARAAFNTALNHFNPAAAPETAAENWLTLSDLFLEAGPSVTARGEHDFSSYISDEDSTLTKLVGALPEPAAWPLIREGLAKRQEEHFAPRRALLQILLAWMARDNEALKGLLEELEAKKLLAKEDWKELKSRLGTDRKTDALGLVEKLLSRDAAEHDNDADVDFVFSNITGEIPPAILEHYFASAIGGAANIPDMAGLLPPEEAESALRKILAQPRMLGEIEGAQTLALAQRVALEMRGELPMPHWALVTATPEGEELHTVYMERFPSFGGRPAAKKNGGFSEQLWQMSLHRAIEGLVVSRLKNNDMDGAAAFAFPYVEHILARASDDELNGWHFAFHTREIPAQVQLAFYMRVLEKFPAHPIHEPMMMTAISCEQEDVIETLLRERMAAPGVSASQRRALQQSHVVLLLAADRLAEALALRVSILAEAPKTKRNNSGYGRNRVDWLEYAFETARLANMAGDAAAENASVDAAIALWKADDESRYQLDKIVRALERAGRVGGVEPFLMDWVARSQSKKNNYGTDGDAAAFSAALLRFYARHGRMADAFALLEHSPWWGSARDVLNVSDGYSSESEGRGGVKAAIANALFEAGRTAEAVKFLAGFMRQNHSRDWTYELLLKIHEDDLEGFIQQMDALYGRDAFEERPMIWKAEALRMLGRLEEAEQTARFALKVDPTDGEQPAGDRVLAYSVLSDILAARGKSGDALFFKDVFKSVRVAEEGDGLKGLGLLKRSMERYAEAETLFADAYCVQWRLAERLREMGRHEEARAHYEMAFERMPEQFGQVASLCFGCMGAFSSPESASAAETVLTRLAAAPPVRPAVHYLMGQLREEQKRYAEAAEWYSKALAGDPDYLDAITRLFNLREKTNLANVDVVALQAKLIRLDPLGRHTHFNADDILDWPTFWSVRNAAVNALPAAPDAVFPLAANIQRIEEEKAGESNSGVYYRSYSHSYSSGRIKTAPEMLADSRVVSALRSLDAKLARGAPGTRRSRTPSFGEALLRAIF